MNENRVQNRIAEAILSDVTSGGLEDTTLGDINKDLDSLISTAGFAASTARSWENWRIANLFDLVISHARNAQAKVASCMVWQEERRAGAEKAGVVK